MPAIDVHAHYFDADLQPTSARAAAAPRVVIDTADTGRIMCGETTFRQVRRTLWDVSERLRELDTAGISHQVISPVPVAMEHAVRPDSDPGYARATNDSIAAACAATGGRLFGLGALPFGDVDAAIGELARCLELGLRGVEIGTRVGALDLDAPELDPFWAALTRRLYADTLVFDDEHLRLLTHRFGPRRLVLGSDAPFFPDQLRKSMRSIDSARESGVLPPAVDHDLLARNARDFLGLPTDS